MSDNSVSYVRTEMLSEQSPPIANIGVVGWLRSNLFPDVFSSILSVVALIVVYMILSVFIPWVFGGVWNANSQWECREVLEEIHGELVNRACWGVIHERFWQLMYGFFPNDIYWRPNLALVMLFAAIAPVLFNGLPKQMLIISIAFPFVAPWLLWGGSVWAPVVAFLGFVIGIIVHKVASKAFGSLTGMIVGVLSAFIWWIFFASMVSSGLSHAIGASRMSSEAARIEAALPVQQAEVDRLQSIVDPIEAKVEELEAAIKVAKDSGAPYAELLTTKAPIKIALGAAVATLSRETGDLKEMERRLARVNSLEADKARLVDLIAEAEVARANVPEAVADIYNPREINEDTMSKDDIALLKVALRAEDKRNVVQNAISSLYADVGLVGLRPVGSRDFGGFMLAILLGITGIVLSLPIGIVLALGRQSDLLIVKTLCVGFIEFIRGVPLITLLFVASVLLGLFLPKGTEFDIILRVMIMITVFASAYMAEVIRGGLAALPTGQYEAADALGLDYWQAQRLIIMPQALKISIPSIVSNFIGLFKDTTLVSIIALSDPIGWVKLIQGNSEWSSVVWELYGFVAFVFFLFCFGMSRYSMYLERKLQTGH